MNFSKSIQQIIATVAPTLASGLLGPYGGMAVNFVLGKLGITATDPKEQQAAIETALSSGNPEVLLKLKEADNDFKLQIAKLGIDEEKLVFDDVANARAREVAVKDSTPRQLAWLLIGGFILVSSAQIFAMLFFASEMAVVPPAVWLQIGNISGYLANEAKQAAAYFFGSTMASKEKDATIADIAKQ